MAATKAGCFAVLFLNSVFGFTQIGQFSVPDVEFEVLKPKGIRVSMPNIPKMTMFAFTGNINKPAITKDGNGPIRGEVRRENNGKWVFEDPNVTLKEGDKVNYYTFVSVDGVGIYRDHQVFKYTGVNNRSCESPTTPTDCQTSQTEVRGQWKPVCTGETIFEDHFYSLNENTWQIEQFIPIENNPEFPFVSYQRSAVSVADGYLRIEPKLQARQPGFNDLSIVADNLDLTSGCTAPACSKQASGSDILPPVVSGRVVSKGFSFKYGTVHVRARVPQGDWLYPEIMLESFLKMYGTQNYASGVLKIASVRGNKELNSVSGDFGNKVLYGGPVMDFKCRHQLLSKKESPRNWGDEFHDYSVHWSPDRIILSVDGSEWARIEPASSGLSGRHPQTCAYLPRNLLASGSKMAPFDQPFYITLGVSAGGISEFPDEVKTKSSRPKPWRNGAYKAMLNFWNDMNSWYSTWSQPALLVDYVKVTAL